MTSRIDIAMPDGQCRAWHFAPPAPTGAGAIIYMDVFGIRPAWFELASRMATLGVHVLLPDLYYRLGPYEPYNVPEAIAGKVKHEEARTMRDRTPVTFTNADTPHFVAALTGLGASGGIAAIGYCMGGGRAMRAANVAPARIAFAASLHGGNLAVDDPDSPHRHLDQIKARLYIGCAGVDFSFSNDQSADLAKALRAAGIDHLIENYVGCAHGWCLPDNPIFHQEGTERHWARLQAMFDETLR